MNELLIETQYIGSCSYWGSLLKADKIYLDKHEHYVKRSYRNRAHILGANGLLRLSIPLVRGKHQHSAMQDVRISYSEQWQKLHWQSFTSAYRRSPFFEFYEDQLLPFYENKYEYLFEYNVALMRTVAKLLKVELPVEFSQKYQSAPEHGITDYRNQILPGKSDLVLPVYTQVFSDRFDFQNDLSVLDLLFNLGSSAKGYLSKLEI